MKIKDRPEFGHKPKPFSLPATATVVEAAATMSEKDYGSVMVVDAEGNEPRRVCRRLVFVSYAATSRVSSAA